MKIVKADELRTIVGEVFHKRGMSERDGWIMADSIVHANMRGVDSHGALRVPHYATRVTNGSINPKPNTKIEKTGPSTAMIDGDDGFGHVTMVDAMDLAIEMAKESGVAWVGVNNSNHCGALSFFTQRAIDHQMIGIAITQTDAAVVPPGARKPFLGTNPLSVGIPSRTGNPILLDMATSTVAGGHIYKARIDNREIPLNWALDSDGKPTSDPHKAVYWTPAAGPKGFGIGIVIDVLTGIMCGGTFGLHIPPMYEQLERKRKLCHLAIAVDYRRFAGGDTLPDMVTQMVNELHQVEPAEGSDGAMAPGEPEYRNIQRREAEGIPLQDEVWEDLLRLSGRK